MLDRQNIKNRILDTLNSDDPEQKIEMSLRRLYYDAVANQRNLCPEDLYLLGMIGINAGLYAEALLHAENGLKHPACTAEQSLRFRDISKLAPSFVISRTYLPDNHCLYHTPELSQEFLNTITFDYFTSGDQVVYVSGGNRLQVDECLDCGYRRLIGVEDELGEYTCDACAEGGDSIMIELEEMGWKSKY